MTASDDHARVVGQVVLSLTTDGFAIVDAETMCLVQVNEAFCRALGYELHELVGRPAYEISAYSREEVDSMIEGFSSNSPTKPSARLYRRKDGSTVVMDVNFSRMTVDGRQLYCAMLRDSSERRLAEEKARESEHRFRTLAAASFEGIAITDAGTLIDGNDQLGELLGAPLSELIGRKAVDMVAPEWRDKLAARFRENAGEPFEHVIIRPDGGRLEVEARAKSMPLGGKTLRVTALRDISNRKHLEAELHRAQRLESVGRLAGGVAHDFNNMLTVILSHVQLLLDGDVAPSQHEDLREIQDAARRAADLTTQLLAFARRGIVKPKVVNLNALVVNLERMLVRLLGEHITLTTAYAKRLGSVRVDPSQMEQVIVNLAINARDAMDSGGKLTIETANVTLGPEYVEAHAEVTPGDYVMVAVSDTGCGMDGETMARVFEPFFTTKSKSGGSGLGLATSYGVVKQLGGSVWVYSEPGRGSSFKVYLPRVHAQPSESETPAVPESKSGNETLLLVEDNDMVRRVAERALQSHGYQVVAVGTPSEAIAAFERLLGRIDAMVTDVVLPQMTGKELAEVLRKKAPTLSVLYTSGYTENTIVHHGVVDENVNFLAKPYLPRELAQRVREMLDSRK